MKTFICPECEKAGVHTSYADGRGLSSHRRNRHRVQGSSHSVLGLRKKEQRQAKPNGKDARRKETGKATIKVKKSYPAKNSAAPKKPAAMPPDEFAPSLLGWAAAKLDNLAEQIARENNLPPKEFAQRAMATYAALVEL